MKLRSIYALLILLIVVQFAPVYAQQKKHKKQVKKTVQPAKKPIAKKPAAKKPLVKTKVTAKPRTAANRLGDEAAKIKIDTTKGGNTKLENKNGTLTEEVIVTTSYKPVLADAVKIRRNPTLEDTVPYKAPLVYVTLDKRLDKDSEIRQLNAMKMPAMRDSDYKNNYVKVGAGSLKTLFGEAYFNNGPDAALQAGGFLKHFSQSGNDFYKQNYSTNEAGIFGKTVGDVNALSGKIDFKNISTDFYGYDPANPPVKLNVAGQHFNILSAEGELAKNYKDVENDFTYSLKLGGYTYSDAYQARENNLVLSGFINQTIKQFYAGLAGSLDLSTEKDSLYNYNNSLIRLNPYLKFQGDNYKIDAGVNIVKEFGFSDRIFVFPAAKLEYQVIPKYVRLFVEAKGDVNRASIYDYAMANPFIDQNIGLKNSVDRLDLAAGLKGTLAPGLSFKADVFHSSVENLPLFVHQFDATQNNNRFGVIYDNGTAQVTGFNGELDFKASDDFNLYGRVEFKDYKLASELEPWNLPKFKLTAGTSIHITDKVIINGTLVIRGTTDDRIITNVINPGGLPASGPLATDTKIITLSSFADVNGGVEYRITGKISIFAQVNNLLNTNYQVWLYYPNYAFSIFGGAKFSF